MLGLFFPVMRYNQKSHESMINAMKRNGSRKTSEIIGSYMYQHKFFARVTRSFLAHQHLDHLWLILETISGDVAQRTNVLYDNVENV